jgi:hypothetical protein
MASNGEPSTETVGLHERFGMGNPWLKKNPYLSLWLSGVNAMAGAAQGQARNAARRRATAATREMSQAVMDAWLAPFTTPKPRRKKRR